MHPHTHAHTHICQLLPRSQSHTTRNVPLWTSITGTHAVVIIMPPGSSVSPVAPILVVCRNMIDKQKRTSVNILLHFLTLLAVVSCLYCLSFQSRAIDITIRIHRFLEGTVFPAEDIVAVIAKAGSAERLRLRNVGT